ncbi:MAG TPA: alanine dehydrogenase [Bacteroidales bacterium]|nr:alanine dehydrogenase [Bacteroidales bacterium]
MYSDQSKAYYNDSTPTPGLMTQEVREEKSTHQQSLIFGLPLETRFQETRILLTPHDAGVLVHRGHRVLVQRNAGVGARFTDTAYASFGAEIVETASEIFKADIILKVMPPDENEIELMKPRQVLFSTLNFVGYDRRYFQMLMKKRITSFCIEDIREEDGSYPVIRAMGEIAGNASIYLASHYLSDPQLGKAKMLGGFSGIRPVEILILGAGTVAEYAIRSALGMGAVVKVFDASVSKIRRLQSLLHDRISTALLTPDALATALPSADVVIGAVYSSHHVSPCILTEKMVASMSPGSVLIDISIDHGGCAESSRITSLDNPVYQHFGVTHYCVPNLLSRFSNTASIALSNYFLHFFTSTEEPWNVELALQRNLGLRNAAYIYHGILTKNSISRKTGIPYKDINLLISSMHQ